MVRYFFHIEGSHPLIDDVGFEFASLRDAKLEAVRLLAGSLNDAPAAFWDLRLFRLTVTDESGLTLFALDLSATDAPALSSRRTPA